jgi:DNA polymerase V
MNRIYACIDLKSFYASVECVKRRLDPLSTNLVVADLSRTQKTICLAVTPSLKSYGLSGRSRLYEVMSKVKQINNERLKSIKGHKFKYKSYDNNKVLSDEYCALDFIIAPPRMREYMKYSTAIYNIYLKYVSRDDIFAYSIDEVFIDITAYLKYYNLNAEEFISKIVSDVYKTTHITATAGIGTNMYLAKIAMDIMAKHMNPNKDGLRIASLDEYSYRKELWNHKPITDFWRVGVGSKRRLENIKLYTMGDIAKCSLENESILYKTFGINAELLIDHAWGYECATIKSVKSYKPESNSLSSSQVLHEP